MKLASVSYVLLCKLWTQCSTALHTSERKKKKVQKRRGKYRKIVRFTPGRVLLHKWQMHRVRKSVEIVLLASALLIVGFGKMEISTRQEELKVYQRLTGNGYYLSTMEITNSPGISRQTVDKLEQVAGVTSVEQYHNNEKEEFWIDLSEYAGKRVFSESSRNIGGISE